MYVCSMLFVYTCANISNIFISISTRLSSNPFSWYKIYSLVVEGCLCDYRVTRGLGYWIYLVEVVDIRKGDYQEKECRTHQK